MQSSKEGKNLYTHISSVSIPGSLLHSKKFWYLVQKFLFILSLNFVCININISVYVSSSRTLQFLKFLTLSELLYLFHLSHSLSSSHLSLFITWIFKDHYPIISLHCQGLLMARSTTSGFFFRLYHDFQLLELVALYKFIRYFLHFLLYSTFLIHNGLYKNMFATYI